MAEPLIYHRIDFVPTDPSENLRDSIGGHPYLPEGMDWPTCSCGNRMNFYLQFDIREEFGLPFEAGSHLSVFQCKACNNQAKKLSESFRNDDEEWQDRLRENYWDFNGNEYEGKWTRFYRLMLVKPGSTSLFLGPEDFFKLCSLTFTKSEEFWSPDPNAPDWVPEDEEIEFQSEPGLPGTTANLSTMQYSSEAFKVGGQPSWGGDSDPPQDLLCSCGAPMGFVCYVPNILVFPNPETDKFTYRHVATLFNGLCVVILACRDQCHPFAVYPLTLA